MPELPEVTTMVNGLKRVVLKKTITDVWTDRKSLFKNVNFPNFKRGVVKAKIVDVFRKGKVVCFQLDNRKVLFVHPIMSGHFLVGRWQKKGKVWYDKNNKALKYVHLILWLNDSLMIALSDLRQFARIELWDTEKIGDAKIIKKLGPDALDITIVQFKKIVEKSQKKIKQLLMNQTLIAGIGNIYADEILFQARVNPFRIGGSLTEREIKKIHSLIRPILEKAIRLGGSSVSDFFHTTGDTGNFQEEIQVYRRNGKRCLVCKTIIERGKIGGRSTHFCPKCQK